MSNFDNPSVVPEMKKTEMEQKSYEKAPLLNENDLQTMSNLEFLERVKIKDRLQYITSSNINSNSILKG